MNSNLNFLPELAVLPSWVCWRHDKDIKYNRDEKLPYCPATGKRVSPSKYRFLSYIVCGYSLDWKDYGADCIVKKVVEHKHLGNDSIILCHNGAKFTADALDF